jgi:hypothetical protein
MSGTSDDEVGAAAFASSFGADEVLSAPQIPPRRQQEQEQWKGGWRLVSSRTDSTTR